MRGASVTSLAAASMSFDRFWSAWPVRKARVKALMAWRQLKPDAALADAIVAAVERQKACEDWLRDGGRFIPHAATWLRGRRWEDDLAPPAAAYSADELAVIDAYNAALGARGWPAASATPYSADRAAAMRAFCGFGSRPGWIAAYFAYLGDKLPPLEGFGFDWTLRHSTYLRAKEGNFAALRESA